jgi:radical SAM protein with 4Fe4S-binding SPASM domain
MNCTYCYADHNNDYVKLHDNEIILNKLISYGVDTITLIGGEPFSHPHFYALLDEIIKYSFTEIAIITNGTLITDDFIEKYSSDGRIYIQVSLDGTNEEENAITRGKNTFQKAFSNVIKMKNAGMKTKVMRTITYNNIKNCLSFYSFFRKLNIDAGFFLVKKVPVEDRPTILDLKTLMDEIYQFNNNNIFSVFDTIKFADNLMLGTSGYPIMHCGGGINTISISPNGDIYPCVKRTTDNMRMSNIISDDDMKLFNSKRMMIIKNDLVLSKDACKECKIKFFCGGGCRAQNDFVNQETDLKDCHYYKLAIDYFFEHIKN